MMKIENVFVTSCFKNILFKALILAVLCMALVSHETIMASPQEQAAQPPERPSAGRNSDPYAALEESFLKTLELEEKKLAYLSERMERTELHAAVLEEAYAVHQAMIANNANMLATPGIDLQSLTRASTRQSAELGNIGNRLSSLSDSISEFERLKGETEEQIRFYRRQIENVRVQPPSLPVDRNLLDPLRSLLEVLEKKESYVNDLIEHYTSWTQRYLSLQSEMKRISTRYENTIRERERERILQHRSSPLLRIAQGELVDDIRQFSEVSREIFVSRLWDKPQDISWDAYIIFLSTFAAFFVIMQGLLYLLVRYLGVIKVHVLEQHYFYRYLLTQIIQRSLFVVGAIAFLIFYPVRPMYQLAPFFVLFPVLIQILFLFLGVQWGLVFLRGMRRYIEDSLFLRMIPLLRLLLVVIFFYGTLYILISRLYCADCVLLTSLRLLGQIGLLAWTAYFLRIFYVNAFGSSLSEYQWFENIRPVVIVVGLAVVLIGILAEVTGYGGMALLWFSGLWHTSLVLVWAYILFGFLKESDVNTYIEKSDDLSEDEFEEQPYPARWLIVRVMRLALAAMLIFSLPLLWGADRTFLADIFYAINFRVRIGDFEFSTIGIVYAALVFLIIHTVSVIWKSVLRDRILKESDMEEGRKDSLTRISVYGLWTVGIMIAMPMMGISGTSLAVVFGAVGIGLGFGLQNIFKDFISGIILLFERPIQVGDTVEIDGMWGIVKEINVRATYVKTYDNSDLIIPNADFISRTVINWSFRDPRLRRRIRVRVAYGSDIKLVKETLMNIAYKHPRVLRRPYPEVYFMDLGESAMLFELRVWLHIDYFIIVETEIRDDISNQFRELGIRIAFPQQDIYIRETPSSFAAVNDPSGEKPPVFGESSA